MVYMYMCISSISQRCRFSAPAFRTPMEAMEHDMLCRIRAALHPLPLCAFPGEVYIRRNEILTDLVRHKHWDSSQDKYEVIASIVQYWSHGSHPERNAMVRIVSTTAQLDDVENVEQVVVPGETQVDLAIFEQLRDRVPNVSESAWDDVDDDMCITCSQNAMCEYTSPECYACYNEH